MPTREYTTMVRRAKRIADPDEGYAKNLAVALGTFHGLNDYLNQKRPAFYDVSILQNLLWQLLHLLIVRSCALMATSKPFTEDTDATLPLIAKLLEQKSLRDEVIREAGLWPSDFHPTWKPVQKADWAKLKMTRFRRNVRKIDIKEMNAFRNAVVAHSTTRKPTPVIIGKVHRAAAQMLRTADLLAFAIGKALTLAAAQRTIASAHATSLSNISNLSPTDRATAAHRPRRERDLLPEIAGPHFHERGAKREVGIARLFADREPADRSPAGDDTIDLH